MAVNDTIQKAIVGDERHNTFPCLFLYLVLRVTNKLNVVVRKGLNILFAERLFIGLVQLFYPFALVRTTYIVGRVAEHHHDAHTILQNIRGLCLLIYGRK